jgi:uncharacterized protein
MRAVTASRVLVDGTASAAVLHLAEPLSLWGGLDAETGVITDVHHPQRGERVTGTVLVMPSGRGSSSSSSVLAEAIRARTGPAAIVLAEADPIVALGAIVADELYGVTVPVVVVDDERAFREVASLGSASIEGDTIHEA